MSTIVAQAVQLMEHLPPSEQEFVYEMIKKVVLAWDPDFTKVTEQEREHIALAEASGFVESGDIDWDSMGVD